MPKSFKRINILLRDSDDDMEYNVRIMEYINDRYTNINDVGYAIAIDVVDDTNINKFIKQGITSIPALILNDDVEYGVNAIIATLAKLEIKEMKQYQDKFSYKDPQESFNEQIRKEMHSGEQEDENHSSSIRIGGADISDGPPNDDELEKKKSRMDAIYAERNKRNLPPKKGGKYKEPMNQQSGGKKSIEKVIESKGYDKNEAAFIRELARGYE